jgi:hypothetical protein
MSSQASSQKAAGELLPVVRASELTVDRPEQQWLIHGLWAASGVGLIGGAPKCCKSWLGLEMAVSLASATPCLGSFAPTHSGRALLYMAEDSASVVRARLDSLCRHRGVRLSSLDIFVITESSLRIDLESQQRRLKQTVAQIRPDMLLLDPLVRLHRIDENSASEVSTLLAYLRALQRELQTAVVLVHHARKNGSANQPGQALRGSSDLHAFGDSNLYLKRHRQQLLLTIEHRAAPSPDPIELRLVGGQTPHLEMTPSSSPAAAELTHAVLDLLHLNGPMTRATIREQLRIRNERLGKALVWLREQGHIEPTAGRWRASANLGKSSAATDAPPNQQAFPFPPSGAAGNGTELVHR